MFRGSDRRGLVLFLAVVLVGTATAVCNIATFFRDSTPAPVEHDSTMTSVEEPLASSEEETRNERRRYQLNKKMLSGELTEAETAECLRLTRNHPTSSDKRAIARLNNVQEMPRTDYPDYRPVPADDKRRSMHGLAREHFINALGFGVFRMVYFQNERGGYTADPAIDRVELVSLLTSSEPNAYVIDDMATPRIAKVAKRRPLDTFESAALDAVRRGENLVYSPVDPTRMFGAIRAYPQCLRCHTDKNEDDLLGAFTYWLKQPADQITP
jgi:hypothetical protein